MPVILPGPAVPSPTSNYNYIFADLVTDETLAILPMIGVTYEDRLNDTGVFAGHLAIGSTQVKSKDWENATIPDRTAVYVDRDGELVWGGVLWTRGYDSTTNLLELRAGTFGSYFGRVPLINDSMSHIVGGDQCDVIRVLIGEAFLLGPHFDMAVSQNQSGIARNLQWFGFEYKWIKDYIDQIQQLPNGFDWSVDVAYDSAGSRVKTFNIWYPRRGRTFDQTGLVWTFPGGNIVSYKWPEDGTQVDTDEVELGAGSGPTMAVGLAANIDLPLAGWPVTFGIVSRKDITDLSMLASYATGDLGLHNTPVTLPTLVVKADRDPKPGTYVAGDDCRLHIVDDRHRDPGYDGHHRIMSAKTTVVDSGADTVELVCGAAI